MRVRRFRLEALTTPASSVRLRNQERYLECDMVNCGGRGVRPTITGALGAVEQGEHLSVTAVAIRNLEKRAVWNSGHQRQADDLLVEPLHGIQIVDAKCDLAKTTDRRAPLVSG
jgi:hypothetical protein